MMTLQASNKGLHIVLDKFGGLDALPRGSAAETIFVAGLLPAGHRISQWDAQLAGSLHHARRDPAVARRAGCRGGLRTGERSPCPPLLGYPVYWMTCMVGGGLIVAGDLLVLMTPLVPLVVCPS